MRSVSLACLNTMGLALEKVRGVSAKMYIPTSFFSLMVTLVNSSLCTTSDRKLGLALLL